MADRIPKKTSLSGFIKENEKCSPNLVFSFNFETDEANSEWPTDHTRQANLAQESASIQFHPNHKKSWFARLTKISVVGFSALTMVLIVVFVTKTSHSISTALIATASNETTVAKTSAFKLVSPAPQMVASEKEVTIRVQQELQKPIPEKKIATSLKIPSPAPEKSTEKLPLVEENRVEKVVEITKVEETLLEEKPIEKDLVIEAVEDIPKENKTMDALAKAKNDAMTQGKYVLAKFGADWCVPCKIMDETVMKDARVRGFLQARYTYATIDIDDLDTYHYNKRYEIKQLPTLLIFNSTGQLVDRHNGTISSAELIQLLDMAQLDRRLNTTEGMTLKLGE